MTVNKIKGFILYIQSREVRYIKGNWRRERERNEGQKMPTLTTLVGILHLLQRPNNGHLILSAQRGKLLGHVWRGNTAIPNMIIQNPRRCIYLFYYFHSHILRDGNLHYWGFCLLNFFMRSLASPPHTCIFYCRYSHWDFQIIFCIYICVCFIAVTIG